MASGCDVWMRGQFALQDRWPRTTWLPPKTLGNPNKKCVFSAALVIQYVWKPSVLVATDVGRCVVTSASVDAWEPLSVCVDKITTKKHRTNPVSHARNGNRHISGIAYVWKCNGTRMGGGGRERLGGANGIKLSVYHGAPQQTPETRCLASRRSAKKTVSTLGGSSCARCSCGRGAWLTQCDRTVCVCVCISVLVGVCVCSGLGHFSRKART